MRNFIINVPQTLILFKIACAILAMQKLLEGAVIGTINDCSLVPSPGGVLGKRATLVVVLLGTR